MLQKQMQPRLERLEPMLGDPLFESILWGHDYDLDGLEKGLQSRIESGQFKRIVFYGMGCSSVVSDIVKGFFLNYKIPMHVQVINDYDLDWFVDRETMKDPATLAIIVCYSGWSVEPCLFFDKMREMTGNKNLIVLSGGGKIASLCKEHGTSLIQYKLRHADREYPLYHVQQFFSIFLDLFHKLKITPSSYQAELEDSVNFLKSEFHEGTLKKAEAIADRLRGSRIALLGTADWYVTLLKQTTMFFNEIAMVPTHRNLLHEFSHTEVATYSDPTEKQAIITFLDSNADDYTKGKVKTLEGLFGSKSVPQNKNIEFINIDLNQDNFFRKFFFGHFFTVYVAFYLGKHANVEGRDLISIAAKNPWWSQKNIELHPKCVDIPSELKG
ncbi:bifunctional phosphoglucose phosphomannose isomerase [Penicillium cf. viridicatum]|uniref:Bifunctional phosphoglucose phosphomannose isomerase n=1 Tax=Penicillium cf. viridicatum TaxID=2972119 RepID=A0A9W9SXS7_9EURO|nr:bifunctional phosphoglucose phosphomannose isomerase [Penicillium cf. viridicatum]